MCISGSSETSAHLLTEPLPKNSLYGQFFSKPPQPLSYVCASLPSVMMTCFRMGGYGLFVKIAPPLNYSFLAGSTPGGTGMVFRELPSRALRSNPGRKAARALRKGFYRHIRDRDRTALCSLSFRSWPEPVGALYFHTMLLSDN